MASKLAHAIHVRLERTFPEKRLFLRSETETRYVRLTPASQFVALAGGAALVGWTIVASAILFMDNLGSGNYRDQALTEKAVYEERLNTLSAERDARAEEALAAHERFSLALKEVSAMQARLLAEEERRKELETGMAALRTTLRTAIEERDNYGLRVTELAAALAKTEQAAPDLALAEETGATLDHLARQLSETAARRDQYAASAEELTQVISDMEYDQKLADERTDRIFQQLEEAVSISLEPLDDMFKSAGLPADSIIETVRRGYSGQGGPLTPLTLPENTPAPVESLRANEIIDRLDRLNLYRIAVQKTPFGMPVKGAYRYTSGFGPRWGRMHEGSDFAAGHGTPIYATADGTVVHAGWQGGYGRLIKIRHDFGLETRYAHLSEIRVKVGDRVSRGDRIGDMGNSGRSTGTHLHYEVLVGGNPKDPMTFIKAARDVF